MPAKRAHVFQHVRVVPVHTGTLWTDTHHTPHGHVKMKEERQDKTREETRQDKKREEAREEKRQDEEERRRKTREETR